MAYDHPSERIYNLRGREVHSFGVEPRHLETGTGTNQGVRQFVNNEQAVPAPMHQQWDASWGVGNQSGHGGFVNDPSANGGRWQAGHLLARQNGGFGHINEGVRPQNAQYNQGNSFNGVSTQDAWRGQEQAFHDAVQQQRTGGTWTTTLRDQQRTPYDMTQTFPSSGPGAWDSPEMLDETNDDDWMPT